MDKIAKNLLCQAKATTFSLAHKRLEIDEDKFHFSQFAPLPKTWCLTTLSLIIDSSCPTQGFIKTSNSSGTTVDTRQHFPKYFCPTHQEKRQQLRHLWRFYLKQSRSHTSWLETSAWSFLVMPSPMADFINLDNDGSTFIGGYTWKEK